MTTLGKIIGIVVDTFNITNARGETTSLRMQWDFSTASDNDIKAWLAGNRRIAFQRPTRSLSIAEIGELDGTVVLAQNVGKKVQSREERIAMFKSAFMASGMDEERATVLATAAIDNPSAIAIANE